MQLGWQEANSFVPLLAEFLQVSVVLFWVFLDHVLSFGGEGTETAATMLTLENLRRKIGNPCVGHSGLDCKGRIG